MSTRERIRTVRAWSWRALVVALLTVVAFLGGVAATHLWPVQTQTEYFSATISLEPRLSSTITLPTVVGDMEMTFADRIPAPGLTAQVQVRDSLTDLLRQGRLRTADLQPTQPELRAAIDDGVREVGWKFAAGALVTTAAVLLVYAASHPLRLARAVMASVTASALALAVPGLAAYLTYRTDRVQEFRTTSLLSLIEGNTDILSGLDRKADQGAVYVTNLLALSTAIREEFTPAEGGDAVAARFLLVSDIHGMNHYPLMREIVRTEQIDAVIDTGDLVNFGQPSEGDLTGIYDGIESLGVPYLFVRGNHDAVSPTDEGLLRRLAQVPNVVLLEPTAGELQVASVHGVTITGFNDTRYFNQRSDDFGDSQDDLAQAYRERTQDLPASDVVLTHQPYSANRVTAAATTINGHMHAADLQRGHLQVGSFTGGGLVNQFRLPPLTQEAQEAAEEDPATAGELTGHPYSFDILTFSEDCAISTLARYSYRNLVSGRPQFDDVSLVNGRSLQPERPEGRTCSPDLGVTVEPIDALARLMGVDEEEVGPLPEPTVVEVTPPDDAVVTTLPPRPPVIIDDEAVTTAPR